MCQSFLFGITSPSLLYNPGYVHLSLTFQGWADGMVVLLLWALQIAQVPCGVCSAQEVLGQGVKDVDTVDLIILRRLNEVDSCWLYYQYNYILIIIPWGMHAENNRLRNSLDINIIWNFFKNYLGHYLITIQIIIYIALH